MSARTTDVATPPAPGSVPPARQRRRLSRLRDWLAATVGRPYAPDVGVCLLFVALGGWLVHGLLSDPATRVLALNPEDQTLVEWFLAYDARLLLGDFSLVTDRLNAPDGINMLTNATTIALGVLLAPITLLFGAPVSFAIAAGGNLAATAIGWYVLYSRGLGYPRLAAGVGAAVCGFAPAMLSQSNSHLHMTSQWLVPPIVWFVVRMARAAQPGAPDQLTQPGAPDQLTQRRRLVTSAVALAALVTVQLFLGEEVLFLAALTLLLFTIGYALARPAQVAKLARRFAAGLLLTGGLVAVALAYPLWVQFAGRQSVPNGPFSPSYFSADLASFAAFSPMSLAGTDPMPLPGSGVSARLTTGAAEYNTFLGWPLLLVVLGCLVWLRRQPVARACAVAGLVMAWLSLGPQLVVNGERTARKGLYILLEGLPVIDGALPMRFAVALVPLIATLLVLAIDRALTEGSGPAWVVVPVVIAAALVPIAPRPLPTTDRAAVPTFISDGHWRDCVRPGGVLVPVPLPTPTKPDAMRWATAANARFGVPEGFFIGPYGRNRSSSIGTYPRPTSQLLAHVAQTGEVPPIGVTERAQARKDLEFWNASCVVLAGQPREAELRATVEGLLGPPERVADAWTWKLTPAA